jgi:hypothetical protein
LTSFHSYDSLFLGEIMSKSEPWKLVESCQYDVNIAVRNGWQVAKYQNRLDKALEVAEKSGISRCEAVSISPSGSAHRCMFNAGHKPTRQRKPENIEHSAIGFTWTEAALKAAVLAATKKAERDRYPL